MTNSAQPPLQVEDDFELFKTLVADQKNLAGPLYQPTNYWSAYYPYALKYLEDHGLRDFRRVADGPSDGFLGSFGCGDYSPIGEARAVIGCINNATEAQVNSLHFFLNCSTENPGLPLYPGELSYNGLNEIAFRLADSFGKECGAKPLANASASLVGNPHPQSCFVHDGRLYTYSFLYYFYRYAYVSRFVDLDTIDNIVEIGPGSGKQTEVTKKLHPHIRFYLLDLAPQLYVAGQFLKSVFPGRVVDYRTLRNEDDIELLDEGAVAMLGNWQVEHLAPQGRTLFWNAASFGEMEPHVVHNYLDIVSSFSDYVYLFQCMGGKEKAADGRVGGVLEQTTWDHYVAYLSHAFAVVDRSDAFHVFGKMTESGGYSDAFFEKRR